jgi:formylglycine-generating enzyme required for sulfatase activity
MPDNAQRNPAQTLRVFLCHSSGDKPAVRELYQRLCDEGMDAWLDEELKAEIGDGEIRPPTEAEWEKAARGAKGNEWPWGNEFDKTRCNSSEGSKGSTTPVDAYTPQGDSPYGAADMVGNVWEWCHSLWASYPYKANDGREKESGAGVRMVRGGSVLDLLGFARAAYRVRDDPGYRCHDRGFRLLVAPRLA